MVTKQTPVEAQRFGVWCVSDGVMGHREAWLKRDDVEVRFDTLDAATAKAAELNAGVSIYNSISYTARRAS